MTSADDILNQIDAALGDTSVSVDAMRCGPDPDDEPRARHAEQVDRALRQVADSDRAAARLYLISRLVANYGLNSFAAGDAVDEAARGLDGPHTHLARAEAQAAIEEVVEPIREFMRSAAAAVTPAVENFGRAMRQLAEAARAAAASSPGDFALAPPQPSRPDHRPARRRP